MGRDPFKLTCYLLLSRLQDWVIKLTKLMEKKKTTLTSLRPPTCGSRRMGTPCGTSPTPSWSPYTTTMLLLEGLWGHLRWQTLLPAQLSILPRWVLQPLSLHPFPLLILCHQLAFLGVIFTSSPSPPRHGWCIEWTSKVAIFMKAFFYWQKNAIWCCNLAQLSLGPHQFTFLSRFLICTDSPVYQRP